MQKVYFSYKAKILSDHNRTSVITAVLQTKEKVMNVPKSAWAYCEQGQQTVAMMNMIED